MEPQFTAGAQAGGYFYQARMALLLLLDKNEECSVSIEKFDDIAFETDGTPVQLVQTKHRSKSASLTDSSVDLWKTLRVWSDYVYTGKMKLSQTSCVLLTTAKAPADSAAWYLKIPPYRNSSKAFDILCAVSLSSENTELQKSFEAFNKLTEKDKMDLIQSIHVIDNADDIFDAKDKILTKIEPATRPEYLEHVFESFDGWWCQQVIDSLLKGSIIRRGDAMSKLRDIAEQYYPDVLPVNFENEAPPDGYHEASMRDQYVLQMQTIDLKYDTIQRAILDYYRAFQQRSQWVREDLLLDNELEGYEKKLVDEWKWLKEQIENDYDLTHASEKQLNDIGRKIFYQVMTTISEKVQIRKRVSEPFIVRGSYHMLAKEEPPRIYWHPKFLERLEQLLLKQGVEHA